MRSIAGVLLNQRCSDVHAALVHTFGSASYCGPGLWAALAVSCRGKGMPISEVFDLIGKGNEGYGRAIGIEAAIGAVDTYEHNRSNQGINYSPLVVLDAVEQTNQATRDIAGCIRTWFTDDKLTRFAGELCDVVGDLHDNVWSHAKSTGVSMAQKWSQPSASDSVFEFALADGGMGFVKELQRSGVAARERIESAKDAIAWCVVRGNSSKIRVEDPWEQRLPDDHMGNPMGSIAKVRGHGNHHLGLGLAKLVELVEKFKGELWLASGDAMMTIDRNGLRKYQSLPFQWAGVILSCRFSVSRVEAIASADVAAGDELDALLDSLIEG